MASFGEFIIGLTILLSLLGGIFCVLRGKDERYWEGGKRLLIGAAVSGALVLLVLVFLLVTHDYRVSYVRDYADRTMSLGFLITSLWGGHQGSLLLWAVLQTWFTAGAVVWASRYERELGSAAVAFLSGLQVFFFLLVLTQSNPFTLLGTDPVDGIGLNPLLRNPYMVFHPPTLFLGFVGFSVPMGFAVAALITGKLEEGWLRRQRSWILFAWVFLSIGNILGMVWAYEELGWGGYWGWDPVENASLMPWITGTALVHSAMAEERRSILKRWNMLLIIGTFLLIIFGTFLTRSGVIQSVHAFSGATTGPYLLGLIAVVGGAALALLFVRNDRLVSKNTVDVWSREWMFSLNNWLFFAATLFVWIATMWPLFTELFKNQRATVPPAFFNKWMVPIGLSILGLLGICILMRWRRSVESKRSNRLIVSIGIGIAVGVASGLLGAYRPALEGAMAFAPAVSFGLIAMVGAALFFSIRKTLLEGEKGNRPTNARRRKLGGQLVHVSVFLMFVGFTGNGFIDEKQGSMGPGDLLYTGDYKIHFLGLRGANDFEKEAVYADLQVNRNNDNLGVLSPARYLYHSHPKQPTSEVVIKTGPLEDLFLILGETDFRNGRAVIRAVVNPFVMWIWVGGVLLVLGTIVCAVPVGTIMVILRMDKDTRANFKLPVAYGLLFTGVVAIGSGIVNLPTGFVGLGAVLLVVVLGCIGSSIVHCMGGRKS